MLKRIFAATALLLLLQTSGIAQTMRFTTNVGSFDMTLNPTNDPNLQPIVDNIVAYIGLGKYHFSAVNRAADAGPGTADDFVLQMGGFLGFPPVPELWAQLNTPVEALTPVTVDGDGDGQVDFNALSNTRGTVSLALSAGNPNSGASSFFVNLGDNNFLDGQGFVPFARIENMATIDQILQLMQTDLTQQIGQPGNLAFSDVPLADNGRLVVVTDVSVVEADASFSFVGPIANALQLASRNSAGALALSSNLIDPSLNQLLAADELPPSDLGGAPPASAVPEPSTVALGLLGVFGALLASRRGMRQR